MKPLLAHIIDAAFYVVGIILILVALVIFGRDKDTHD